MLELPEKKHVPFWDDKVLRLVSQEPTLLSFPPDGESPWSVKPTEEKE